MTAEIINPNIKRVDAVDGPATGMPFLILKSSVPPKPATAPVVKADDDLDLEATDVQDGPNIDGTTVDDGDAAEAAPGAPAWEALDAAKARTATDALVAARDCVRELCGREAAEGDDDGNVWDLSDAADLLDAALGILAKFAVDEQNEADTGQAEAEADARSLGLIKSLVDRRTPKEDAVTVTTDPVVKADEVMVAVYGPDGSLMGSVASDDIVPLAAAPDADSDAVTDGDAAPAADAADPAAPADPAVPAPEPVVDAAAPVPDAAPAAPAATPAAPDAAPAPAAPAGDDDTVTKSLDDRVAEAVAKALSAAVATAIEPLVKSNTELAERVQKMSDTPRNNGPMLSGQMPHTVGNPALRGQNAESLEGLRKSLATESDPGAAVIGVANLIKTGWAQR